MPRRARNPPHIRHIRVRRSSIRSSRGEGLGHLRPPRPRGHGQERQGLGGRVRSGRGKLRLVSRLASVKELLLDWFSREGRDLPWRGTRDPYAILVSEVMLQQTQVPRVVPRYTAWLERWPTVDDLAAGS